MLQKVIERSEEENSMKSQIDTLITFFFVNFRSLTLFFVGFSVSLNIFMFNYISILNNIKI